MFSGRYCHPKVLEPNRHLRLTDKCKRQSNYMVHRASTAISAQMFQTYAWRLRSVKKAWTLKGKRQSITFSWRALML
jgi:hypothetical protein